MSENETNEKDIDGKQESSREFLISEIQAKLKDLSDTEDLEPTIDRISKILADGKDTMTIGNLNETNNRLSDLVKYKAEKESQNSIKEK